MKSVFAALAAIAAAAAIAAPADAAYVINVLQVGPNVVATGSGSFDLAGLTAEGRKYPVEIIDPAEGFINVGLDLNRPQFLDDSYVGLSGPSSFGSGARQLSFSIIGPSVAIDELPTGGRALFVPHGYVSGAQVGTSTATWRNSTLASLGATPGTYVWTWGSGAQADSLTLNIGPVPEPTTWAMLILGLGMVGIAARRRRAGMPVAV